MILTTCEEPGKEEEKEEKQTITFSKTYGGSDWDGGVSIQQTTDGGYIISGFTNSYGNGGQDAWLVKTDSVGGTLWTQTFGGSSTDASMSVQQTTDGGYVIVGYTDSFGNGYQDFYLTKTDSQGNEEWNKTIGGTEPEMGYSIQQTTDGGYIITGEKWSGEIDGYDFWLIKTDSQGDEEWNKTYGGSDWDNGRSVQQTTDGGYIIAGQTGSFGNGGTDVWLIKTDSEGNTVSYGD